MTEPMPHLTPGARSPAVRELQRLLAIAGFATPPRESGHYGEGTAAALKRFQSSRCLPVTGLCTPDTWKALLEATYRLGDRNLYLRTPPFSGDDVRELQRRLNTLGFDAGKEDGIFGARTARALVEFQKHAGLPADGILGPATLRALLTFSDHSGKQSAAPVRERRSLYLAPSTRRRTLIIDVLPEDPLSPESFTDPKSLSTLALRLSRTLRLHGFQVRMTAKGPSIPPLQTRIAHINRIHADLLVCLAPAATPPATLHYFGIESFHSAIGKRAATLIHAHLSGSGVDLQEPYPLSIPILRLTRPPAVLLRLHGPPAQRTFLPALAAALQALFSPS